MRTVAAAGHVGGRVVGPKLGAWAIDQKHLILLKLEERFTGVVMSPYTSVPLSLCLYFVLDITMYLKISYSNCFAPLLQDS